MVLIKQNKWYEDDGKFALMIGIAYFEKNSI